MKRPTAKLNHLLKKVKTNVSNSASISQRLYHNFNFKRILNISDDDQKLDKLIQGESFDSKSYSSTIINNFLTWSDMASVKPEWKTIAGSKDLAKTIVAANSTMTEPAAHISNSTGSLGRISELQKVDKILIRVPQDATNKVLEYLDLPNRLSDQSKAGSLKPEVFSGVAFPDAMYEFYKQNGEEEAKRLNEGLEENAQVIALATTKMALSVFNFLFPVYGYLSAEVNTRRIKLNDYTEAYSPKSKERIDDQSFIPYTIPDITVYQSSAVDGKRLVSIVELKKPHVGRLMRGIASLAVDNVIDLTNPKTANKPPCKVLRQIIHEQSCAKKSVILISDGTSSTTCCELMDITKDDTTGEVTAHMELIEVSHKKGLQADRNGEPHKELTPIILIMYAIKKNLDEQEPTVKAKTDLKFERILMNSIRTPEEVKKLVSEMTEKYRSNYPSIFDGPYIKIRETDVVLTENNSKRFRKFIGETYVFDQVLQTFQLPLEKYLNFFQGQPITEPSTRISGQSARVLNSSPFQTPKLKTGSFIDYNRMLSQQYSTFTNIKDLVVNVELVDLYSCKLDEENNQEEKVKQVEQFISKRSQLIEKLSSSKESLNPSYGEFEVVTIKDSDGDIISYCLVSTSITSSDGAEPIVLTKDKVDQLRNQKDTLKELSIGHGNLSLDSFLELDGRATITGYSDRYLNQNWVTEKDEHDFEDLMERYQEPDNE